LHETANIAAARAVRKKPVDFIVDFI